MKQNITLSIAFAGFVAAGMCAKADTVSYYVAIDSQATLTSGTYIGLANPNQGRLTLLFNHGDHFHGIGAFSYTGSATAPIVTPTNTNNRLPEISSAEPPLALGPGQDSYVGRLVNEAGPSEYSDIEVASIQSLADAAPGSPESVLFNSSSNRWSLPLSGTQVGLELLSATPGLTIGNGSETNLFASSATTLLGSGSGFVFEPVFSTALNAQAGTYSATFRLVGTGLQPSGEFSFDFAVPQAVPEPSSTALALLGLTAALAVTAKARFQRRDASEQ